MHNQTMHKESLAHAKTRSLTCDTIVSLLINRMANVSSPTTHRSSKKLESKKEKRISWVPPQILLNITSYSWITYASELSKWFETCGSLNHSKIGLFCLWKIKKEFLLKYIHVHIILYELFMHIIQWNHTYELHREQNSVDKNTLISHLNCTCISSVYP